METRTTEIPNAEESTITFSGYDVSSKYPSVGELKYDGFSLVDP